MSEPAVDTQMLDRHECRVCGYVYEPAQGDSKYPVSPEHRLNNCRPLGVVRFVVLEPLSSQILVPRGKPLAFKKISTMV